MINQAVGVPEGVAVILHALEDANGGQWGLFLHNWWRRRRRRWGRLLWWRGRRLGHCFRLRGFLWGTVGVVTRVAKDRHCTSGHVDYVGLAERVLPIAEEQNISLGNDRRWRWWRRSGGCRWFCRFGDSFHWWWRGHSQFVLVVGSIWSINVLQVPHLLVDHPQLVSLIKLKMEEGRKQHKHRSHCFCLMHLNFQS